MHKGHYGQYSGNAKWSRVTSSNMGATKRDDEAHMDYLKQDVDYDDKHGHSDSSMTADEKHISKLAGDLKYDEKNHGSPAKHTTYKHMFIDDKKSGGKSSSQKLTEHMEAYGKHGDKKETAPEVKESKPGTILPTPDTNPGPSRPRQSSKKEEIIRK